MKILFLTHPYPNYAPDLLLHGLRKLLGPDVIDFPKKECLYQGVLGLGVCPEDQKCPNWFPDDTGDIDRDDIRGKLKSGYFQYIVSDYRAFNMLCDLQDLQQKIVVVDGEDLPARISQGKYIICRRETDGSDFSIPLPMSLPEELLHWITSYDNAPKRYSIGFLGSTNDGARKRIAETLAQLYPDALFQTSSVPSRDDPSPDGRLSRDNYYLDLQKCRIVLSLPGAGYDTFRFWENAACNAVHVAVKMPLYIPDDFVERRHILRFSRIDELRVIIDDILEDKAPAKEIIRDGRRHLVDFHLTTERAKYFLKRVEKAFLQ